MCRWTLCPCNSSSTAWCSISRHLNLNICWNTLCLRVWLAVSPFGEEHCIFIYNTIFRLSSTFSILIENTVSGVSLSGKALDSLIKCSFWAGTAVGSACFWMDLKCSVIAMVQGSNYRIFDCFLVSSHLDLHYVCCSFSSGLGVTVTIAILSIPKGWQVNLIWLWHRPWFFALSSLMLMLDCRLIFYFCRGWGLDSHNSWQMYCLGSCCLDSAGKNDCATKALHNRRVIQQGITGIVIAIMHKTAFAWDAGRDRNSLWASPAKGYLLIQVCTLILSVQ